MHAVTVHLSDDLLSFVRRTAERETRPVSLQIRHFIIEAARRAGNPAPAAGDNPSGNPPLPVVSPATMGAVKAELAELDAETARLTEEQRRLGYKFGPGDERRLIYVRSRASAIRSHVEVMERMGART